MLGVAAGALHVMIVRRRDLAARNQLPGLDVDTFRKPLVLVVMSSGAIEIARQISEDLQLSEGTAWS